MIKLSNLKFSYPNDCFNLNIPDLEIQKGETVAVIGPSGTGKTTLLNLIAGVLTAHSGEIHTNGLRLSKLGDEQRRHFRLKNVGMVFQSFELLEYLNVYDNILLPFRMSSELKLDKSVYSRVQSLAESTGIVTKLRRSVSHLSQGERQRVAFCRAVITNPPLLLADEPTGNLDPENTGRLLDILFEHVRVTHSTLVTVTHEHSYLDLFDRVLDFTKLIEATANA